MNIDKLAFRKNAIRVGLASFLAGGIGFSQTTASETAAKTETELPEIVVSAHMTGVPHDNTGVSVTKLNPEKLEKEGVHTLSEALTRSPGVYIMSGGGVNQRGSATRTVIRGMNSDNYTLPVIDGIRLNGAGSLAGSNVFGMTDLFTLGNIEVLRGSQGANYGSTAVGGVVAMETPDGQGEPSVRIFTEGGSFNSLRSSLIAQGEIKKLSYFVGAGYEQTNNDPLYPAYLDRSNKMNDFRQWSEVVKLGYQVNDKVRVSGTFRHQDGKLEDPAFSYFGNEPFKTDLRTILSLGSGKVEAELSRMWTTSLMAGFYNQNFSQIVPDVPATVGMSNYNSSWKKVQVEWRNLLTWNAKHKTTAGFAWDRNTFETTFQPWELENIYAFFAEHMYSPIKGLDLSLSGRLEESSIWSDYATWRAAASWKIRGEHSKTRLLGSIGSGFRAPTAWERGANYSLGGWTTVGNPDLGISKSLGGDLGIEQKIAKNHSITVSGFWIRINNQIDIGYTPNGDSTWDNYAYATSYGVETAFRGDFKDAWNSGYTVAYTYTLPENSDKKQLTYTAQNVFSVDIHTSPIASVTTGFGLEAATARTGGRLNQKLDNYAIIRWYARWQANKNLALHLRVENMSNQRYAVQDYGYPTLSQGLSIQGGVTLTF